MMNQKNWVMKLKHGDRLGAASGSVSRSLIRQRQLTKNCLNTTCSYAGNKQKVILQPIRFCVMHQNTNSYSAKTWQTSFVTLMVSIFYNVKCCGSQSLMVTVTYSRSSSLDAVIVLFLGKKNYCYSSWHIQVSIDRVMQDVAIDNELFSCH